MRSLSRIITNAAHESLLANINNITNSMIGFLRTRAKNSIQIEKNDVTDMRNRSQIAVFFDLRSRQRKEGLHWKDVVFVTYNRTIPYLHCWTIIPPGIRHLFHLFTADNIKETALSFYTTVIVQIFPRAFFSANITLIDLSHFRSRFFIWSRQNMQWRMRNNTNSPLNVICRELHRLESDPDRLQMMVTLRSRLAHLQFASSHFQLVLSNFQTEEYRWQAIQQILPYVTSSIQRWFSFRSFLPLDSANDHTRQCDRACRTFCSTRISFKSHRAIEKLRVGACRWNESSSLVHLSVDRSLKANQALNEKLRQEYRPDVHSIVAKSEEHLPMPEHQQDAESNMPKVRCVALIDGGKYCRLCIQALTSSSGVFEKAKQFVCRVFGSGSYSSSSGLDDSPKKRLMTDDQHERKRLHVAEDERESFIGNDDKIEQQSHPASCSLTLSRSYVSLVNECPPPSPTSPHTTIHLTEDILADLNTTLRNQYVSWPTLVCSSLLSLQMQPPSNCYREMLAILDYQTKIPNRLFPYPMNRTWWFKSIAFSIISILYWIKSKHTPVRLVTARRSPKPIRRPSRLNQMSTLMKNQREHSVIKAPTESLKQPLASSSNIRSSMMGVEILQQHCSICWTSSMNRVLFSPRTRVKIRSIDTANSDDTTWVFFNSFFSDSSMKTISHCSYCQDDHICVFSQSRQISHSLKKWQNLVVKNLLFVHVLIHRWFNRPTCIWMGHCLSYAFTELNLTNCSKGSHSFLRRPWDACRKDRKSLSSSTSPYSLLVFGSSIHEGAHWELLGHASQQFYSFLQRFQRGKIRKEIFVRNKTSFHAQDSNIGTIQSS